MRQTWVEDTFECEHRPDNESLLEDEVLERFNDEEDDDFEDEIDEEVEGDFEDSLDLEDLETLDDYDEDFEFDE